MNANETIYLVACINKKRSNAAADRDLYDSELFRRMRVYVESRGHPFRDTVPAGSLYLSEDFLALRRLLNLH
jgi:hypothetical protein